MLIQLAGDNWDPKAFWLGLIAHLTTYHYSKIVIVKTPHNVISRRFLFLLEPVPPSSTNQPKISEVLRSIKMPGNPPPLNPPQPKCSAMGED